MRWIRRTSGSACSGRIEVTILGALGFAPAAFAAVAVVTMRFLMSLGVGLTAAAVLAVPTFLALIVAGIGPRTLRGVRIARPCGQELLTLAALLLILAALWDRAADRSLLWPHSYGVDQAHHAAVITAILDSNHLPTPDPRLGGMSNYPVGAHLLAAGASRTFGWNPIVAMWVVALASIGMQLFSISWLARCCAPRRSWLAPLAAVVVWLLGWRMGLSIVTVSFWFAQSVSIALVVPGVALLTRSLARNRSLGHVAAISVFAVAVAVVYPQSAPILPGAAVAAGLRGGDLRRGKLLAARHWRALVALVMLLGLASLKLARQSPYLTARAIGGNNEGVLLKLTVGAFGGWFVIGLMMWGAVELLIGARKGNRAVRTLLGAMAPPLIVAAMLLQLRSAGFPVTRYRIVKNLYALEPFFAVAAAAGICAVAITSVRRVRVATRRAESAGMWAALLLAAGFFWSSGPLRLTSLPLVDQDAYALARFAARNGHPSDYGLAGDSLSPYVLWWSGLRRDAPVDTVADLIPRMSRWDTWPEGSPEKYLIVDATALDRYVARTDVRVLYQHGQAAILERNKDAQ